MASILAPESDESCRANSSHCTFFSVDGRACMLSMRSNSANTASSSGEPLMTPAPPHVEHGSITIDGRDNSTCHHARLMLRLILREPSQLGHNLGIPQPLSSPCGRGAHGPRVSHALSLVQVQH